MTLEAEALLAALPRRLSDIPQRWAMRTPDAPALCEGALSWTYRDLHQAVQAAAALLRELQVRPGDRVMIVGENCALQVALIFAAGVCDAWAVCVNARLSARELDAIRDHCGARRVLYTIGVSPDAAAHAERHGATPYDAEHVVEVDATREAKYATGMLGALAIGALNLEAKVEPVAAESHEQVAALIYTTGTTGTPKGVMLTHRNLLFIAQISSTLRSLVSDDRVYGVLPISHVYGLASVMLGTLNAGACLYLVPRYTPHGLLDALRNQGITMLQGVPAMYARLLECIKDAGADTQAAGQADRQAGGQSEGQAQAHAGHTLTARSLRFIYAGGSPLDPTLKREVEQLFGQPLHNGYGMTESSPTISQTRREAPRQDTSVGPAIPGIDVRIVDSAGRDVAAGEPGELWVRGPNVMKGYYREPILTAQALLPGGWLNTGDIAQQADDGALFIVGRTKELIIRSGFNVYPVEVETALNSHPSVIQSAVVGRTVADGNEEVVAFVELDPAQAVAIDGLHTYLAKILSPYKCPTEIVAMQALPAAATGKILKGRLKQQAQQMYEARQQAPQQGAGQDK
jgi:long-chain acyl-CoA synthetase